MTPSPVDVQPCTEPVGPTVPVSSDPLQMFAHFFDDEVIDLIVRETNRFALQSLAGTNKTWETNTEEIKAYQGFRIIMGIHHCPEIRDYWCKDEKLHCTYIASRITHDRFEAISRYFHFVNNETLPSRGQDGYHQLQKVLPIINLLNRFLRNYTTLTHRTVLTKR